MNKAESIYEKLSEDRKREQEEGGYPMWYSTGGYQMFKQKYLYEAKNFREQITRIANTAAKHAYRMYGDEYKWEKEFFNLLWEGDLSPSTPVLANMGTDRAFSVSCSGQEIGDGIDSFYSNLRESALLTKMAFGTSAYLGNIRPRGEPIRGGGTASGVVPVLDDFITMSRKISQGSSRRGAFAGYIEPTHKDFYEVLQYLKDNIDDTNIGWNLTDAMKSKLDEGDEDTTDRWKKICNVKTTFGKGYYSFIDKVNRARPQCYKDRGLFVKASNLCDEITLFSDQEHTYTCVLSSIVVSNWDSIVGTDKIFLSTIFLDCVCEDFIQNAEGKPGFEKAVRFTKKGRALGLGQCGLHTLFQKKLIPFESFEAYSLNAQIAKTIYEESERASRWMAERAGEVEWTKGTGLRNTHRLACAPTKSTALLMGGVSEGINPDPAMCYTQTTPAGEIDRLNPILLQLMKDKGVYTKKHVQEVVEAQGSVQKVSWLSDEEKRVYKTAFEMDMMTILRMGSARQRWLDQGQSLNLFFSAEEQESYISKMLQAAWEDPYILGVYYSYSQAGVSASKDNCESCN